eukprot:7837934-Heterocapsa_arctica.AAC.1
MAMTKDAESIKTKVCEIVLWGVNVYLVTVIDFCLPIALAILLLGHENRLLLPVQRRLRVMA